MSDKQENLYELLGLAKDASADSIRSQYRKLAREFHPDANPDNPDAEERFKAIASAYEVLSDVDKRKAYDEFGADSLRMGFNPAQARAAQQWGGNTQRSARPFAPEYVNLEDLFGGGFGGGFGDAFGGGFGGQRQAVRGADVHAVAELDLAQVVNGTEVSLVLPGQRKPTRVRIPAGAESGSKIRLRGKGSPGTGGAASGDVVIETRVKPHPQVKRKGLDLTLRLPVTLAEAYNGASVEVPTFSGSVRLTIPALSQNGTKLRLRNRGIKRKKKRGDFYVELEVRMPTQKDQALSAALASGESAYDTPVRAGLHL